MHRIAVVEDNHDNRLLLQVVLHGRYEVDEYSDGREALAGFRARPPDLVLLDISLPEMDGTEILDVIRSDPALERLPVVAVTAHAMAGDRERYLAQGFDDYISKPIIKMDDLFETIERCLVR